LAYSLVINAFTPLELQGPSNGEMKHRIYNVVVEIKRGCRLRKDEMPAGYVISLSKFKLEEQLFFAAKVNMIYMHRLQDGLNAFAEYIEGIHLNKIYKKK